MREDFLLPAPVLSIVRHMSEHFKEQWKRRVGALPSIEGLNRILLESFQIEKQKRLWRPGRGGGLVPYWLLSAFWNHRIGIIVKVDEYTGTAVTVLTPNEAQGARRWHGLKPR